MITISGDERPGSIFQFSSYLAEKGVNITDLYGDTQAGRFVLVSEVQVPPQWDIGMLQADLEHLGQQTRFHGADAARKPFHGDERIAAPARDEPIRDTSPHAEN